MCLDFIQSQADGRFYCIECNPRTSSIITEYHDHPGLAAAYTAPATVQKTVIPLQSTKPTYWYWNEFARLVTTGMWQRECIAASKKYAACAMHASQYMACFVPHFAVVSHTGLVIVRPVALLCLAYALQHKGCRLMGCFDHVCNLYSGQLSGQQSASSGKVPDHTLQSAVQWSTSTGLVVNTHLAVCMTRKSEGFHRDCSIRGGCNF